MDTPRPGNGVVADAGGRRRGWWRCGGVTLVLLAVALLAGLVAVAGPPAAAGDRVARPVVTRGSTWYVRDTLTGGIADRVFTYGQPGDVQLMGDWDGNGTTTIGVKRRSRWLLRNSNQPGAPDVNFSYGLGCDLGFSSPGGRTRDRGSKGLPAALRAGS